MHYIKFSIIILIFIPVITIAQNNIDNFTEQTIWDIENIPENEIDIGLWSLIIAREIDSTIDVYHYLRKLDEMAEEIKRMIAGRTDDNVKLAMIIMFIYEPGIRNDNYPFAYDLDDPMGFEINNRLLSTYIDTRKGNCVSMPNLFLALAERVDPDLVIHCISAPKHLFCRFYDRQTGKIINIEPTNMGSFAREEWIIESMRIPQVAIDSGIYMKDLSKKELIGELIGTLPLKYRREGSIEKSIEYSDLMLRLNPKSPYALINKGALLAQLGHNLQESIKREGRRPRPDERERLKLYKLESDKYINRAIALGWQLETPEQREAYLKLIEEEKSRRNIENGE